MTVSETIFRKPILMRFRFINAGSDSWILFSSLRSSGNPVPKVMTVHLHHKEISSTLFCAQEKVYRTLFFDGVFFQRNESTKIEGPSLDFMSLPITIMDFLFEVTSNICP